VTDGGNSRIMVLDAATGATLRTATVPGHPDSIAFDAADQAVLVTNAAGTDATLVGLAPLRPLATIGLGGRPESAVADRAGHIFVNVSDRNDIAVIAGASRQVVARYGLKDCQGPSGLALDAADRVLIAACDNRRAVVLRASDGRMLASLPIGAGADAVVVDPAHHRAFIPCGDSASVSVLALTPTGGRIASADPTAIGARTAGYDPASGRLYLPTATPGPGRMIQFGEPVAKPIPGTARLLWLSP
jgi:DNA-binding beta-propeller fold protein YncE